MWTFHQRTGALTDASCAVIAHGYSGAPEGKNDPSKQNIANVGPIPRGVYSIAEPHNSAKHGPFCLSLVPHERNEMFGRRGFLMHGDSKEHPGAASEGCVIMPFSVRFTVWQSNDRTLIVTE
jgi:hypothetical protein